MGASDNKSFFPPNWNPQTHTLNPDAANAAAAVLMQRMGGGPAGPATPFAADAGGVMMPGFDAPEGAALGPYGPGDTQTNLSPAVLAQLRKASYGGLSSYNKALDTIPGAREDATRTLAASQDRMGSGPSAFNMTPKEQAYADQYRQQLHAELHPASAASAVASMNPAQKTALMSPAAQQDEAAAARMAMLATGDETGMGPRFQGGIPKVNGRGEAFFGSQEPVVTPDLASRQRAAMAAFQAAHPSAPAAGNGGPQMAVNPASPAQLAANKDTHLAAAAADYARRQQNVQDKVQTGNMVAQGLSPTEAMNAVALKKLNDQINGAPQAAGAQGEPQLPDSRLAKLDPVRYQAEMERFKTVAAANLAKNDIDIKRQTVANQGEANQIMKQGQADQKEANKTKQETELTSEQTKAVAAIQGTNPGMSRAVAMQQANLPPEQVDKAMQAELEKIYTDHKNQPGFGAVSQRNQLEDARDAAEKMGYPKEYLDSYFGPKSEDWFGRNIPFIASLMSPSSTESPASPPRKLPVRSNAVKN